MAGEPETKWCNKCNRELPIEEFPISKSYRKTGEAYSYRRYYCQECARKKAKDAYNATLSPEKLAKKIAREELLKEKMESNRTCKNNCVNYPCFKGIDTMKSNLALTCVNFNEK